MEISGERGLTPRSRKSTKGKKAGHRPRGGKPPKPDSLREQPIADSIGTVPCKLCGHPVDPNRLHAHMVRFHGAAFRSKST